MAYNPKKYRYELGDATLREARSAASAPAPLGRTAEQINREKSLATNQANQGALQAKSGMARNLGGTMSPLYAMLAGRADLGAAAQASGAAMDIDAQEAQRAQELEMTRRSQMMGVGQLGLGYSQLEAQTGLEAEQNAMQQQQIDQNYSLGARNLAVQEQQQALSRTLGMGNLSLQTELGRGNLDLGNRSLGVESGLGYARIEQQAAEAQMQFQLGMMRLGQQQQSADREFDFLRYNAQGMGGGY